MGVIQYSSSILMVSLFTIAIISFGISFALDNNVAVSLSDDEVINDTSTSIRGNITLYHSDINQSSLAYTESTIAPGSETFESGGVWKTMTGSLPKTITNIFILAKNKLFGNKNSFGIVFTALIGFLAMIAVLYGWKAWRGNPD